MALNFYETSPGEAGTQYQIYSLLYQAKAEPVLRRDEDASVDKWLIPLNEPVRFRRLSAALQSTTVIGDVPRTSPKQNMDWFVRLNEPVRFRALPRSEYAPTTVLGRPTITVPAGNLDWFKQFNEPVRLPLRLTTGAQQFLSWDPRYIQLTTETIEIEIEVVFTAVPTSDYEQMLLDQTAQFSYSAYIQPWVLSDRGGS